MPSRRGRIILAASISALVGAASIARAATTYTVVVGGSEGEMTFTPADITIAKGDSIHFENAGGTHNVHADDGSFKCSLDCTLHNQPSAQPWQISLRFNQVRSTFGYYCDAHGNVNGGMRGSITVVEVDPIFSDGFDDAPARARP